MAVYNDEDSGFIGYWALDDYVKTIIVWQNPTTTPYTCEYSNTQGLGQLLQGLLARKTVL